MSTREKVLEYIRSVDHSPTLREIGEAVGTSGSAVQLHVAELEIAGKIKRVGVQRRIYAVREEAA